MGKIVLLDQSPTGVNHLAEVDDKGITFAEHTPTVVEQQILDDCAKKRGLVQRKGSAFQHAGQIPINTHAAWKREWREHFSDRVSWPTFLAQKMNSRDYGRLRTDEGKSLPTTDNRRMV